jgi:hypothetical protein
MMRGDTKSSLSSLQITGTSPSSCMGLKTQKKAVEPQPDMAAMMAAMAPQAWKSTQFTNAELEVLLHIIQALKPIGN